MKQAKKRGRFLALGLCNVVMATSVSAQAMTPQSGMAQPAEPLQTTVDRQRQAVNAPPSAPLGSSPAASQLEPASGNGEPQPLRSLAGVNTDYRIAPSDLIEFDIFGIPNMQRAVRVNASGLVSLPLIGAVQVAGLTGQQAEQMIAAKYAEKYLQDPQVSIFIKEFTTQRVTIEGAVLKPGIYPVTGQLSLLQALALAGGYAQYAELTEIMLYRSGANGQRQAMTFDLEKVRAGEVMDPEVLPEDVIVVKRNARRTALRDSIFRDIIDTINPFSNR